MVDSPGSPPSSEQERLSFWRRIWLWMLGYPHKKGIGFLFFLLGGIGFWIGWEWNWLKENEHHELVRNLVLVGAGFVGSYLLLWRTISANLAAQAATDQAANAVQQARQSDQANQEQAKHNRLQFEQSEKIAREQAEHNRKTNLADLFVKAGGLLGSPQLFSRLTGVYAFEQVANEDLQMANEDSEGLRKAAYRGTVLEILAAFLRQKRTDNPAEEREKAPADIQAAITVIGRLNALQVESESEWKADLFGADLRWVRFEGDLSRADLRVADFYNATLINATFRDAEFGGTNFSEANLLNANLQEARLDGDTKLDGANMSGTRLKHTTMNRVDLKGVKGLRRNAFLDARASEDTRPPAYLAVEWSETERRWVASNRD